MEDRGHRFSKGVLTGVLCSLAIVSAIIWGVYVMLSVRGGALKEGTQASGEGLDYGEIEEKLSLLKGVVDSSFLYGEDIDEEAMADGIYKGFIESLGDPYTVYYTEEEYQELMEGSSGEYVGIGVQMSQDLETKLITVIQVFKGSGAEEAGLKVGDVLSKVNGQDISGEDIDDVVAQIKGGEGTPVTLEVYRESVKDFVTMEVERRSVSVDTVQWQLLEEGLGYIQITEFDQVTYGQFTEALEELKAQGMKKLVLDLRNNPGGLLASCIDVADAFLDQGVIVSTRTRLGDGTSYEADEDVLFDGPMTVLINENSASASEVLTGALKDHDRATVVGTVSYGKGIVQNIIPLGDGTGIKVTTSDYYTPNGASIHGVGITPDIEVEAGDGEADVQLERAKEALRAETGE